MRVKICGLNPARDVQVCIDLNVDFLGFVFYEKSPRNLNLQEVKELKNYNKKFIFCSCNCKPKQRVYSRCSFRYF